MVIWALLLRKGLAAERAKALLVAALIGFPVFVGFVGILRILMGARTLLWDCVIAPGITAYVIGLSLIGLFLARQLGQAQRSNRITKRTSQQAAPSHGDKPPALIVGKKTR